MHLLPYTIIGDLSLTEMRKENMCKFFMLRSTELGFHICFFSIDALHLEALKNFQKGRHPVEIIAAGACNNLALGMPQPFFGSQSFLKEFGFDRPPNAYEHFVVLETVRRTMDRMLSQLSIC